MIARNEKSIVKLERWYILRVLMLKDFRTNYFCASLLRTQIHNTGSLWTFTGPLWTFRLFVNRWPIVFVSGIGNLAPRAFFPGLVRGAKKGPKSPGNEVEQIGPLQYMVT